MKEGVFTSQEQAAIQEARKAYMREYMREYRKTHPAKKRPYKPVPKEKKREYQNRYWLNKAKKMLNEV